jgi:simple sugar transport system permease protein
MSDAWVTVLAAVFGGALRVSTPFLFVSLGECITEKSGRVNLGLEGTLVFGAMVGYAVSYHTGSAWWGLLAAGLAGVVFGTLHGWICSLPRVNDIAIGIALMILGLGLAFFFGKAYVQPTAPRLPTLDLGGFATHPAVRAALQINVLLPIGAVAAVLIFFGMR